MNIQVNLMLEMFKTQVLPACIDYQEKIASSALHIKKLDLAPPSLQLKLLEELNESINHAMVLASELADLQAGLRKLPLEKQGEVYCEQVVPKCEELRKAVDHLEATVDDSLWPLPKYRELLFLI
jgi:glutamine synthetase